MADQQPYRPDRVERLTPETDFFGHEDYADALCREVRTVPAPFTLGFFAPWGAGKSTVLGATADRLNERSDVAAVVFDVWKYEGDSLRREFVTDGKQLKAQGKLRRGFKLEQHLERFEADVAEPRPTIKADLRYLPEALWRAGVAAAVVLLVFLVGSAIGLKGTDKLLLALASGLVTSVVTSLGKTVRVEQIQVTRKQLQDPDQFADNFEGLLRDGLNSSRLVIAIDNLDRCSPARVTELLSTIKTFLEPVKSGKELVFIVAADDRALRRHLIAQELEASGGEAVSSGSSIEEASVEDGDQVEAGVPDKVTEAVDEYLRKFFNGTLRLTEVLDEDILEFAQAQLKDFVASHKMDEAAASQLTELVARALKQNPRRIKQFINGLELRLQLLEQRRRSDRIQIDPNVLVVAKLAIMEEEWNDRFNELRRDPRLLAAWHEQARGGRDQEGDDQDYPRWQVFLRNTEQIRPPDIRPYLFLKQSRLELRLPRYQEFVDAVEEARVDAAEELLGDPDVAGQQDEYVAAIPDRLKRAIQRNFASTAANIVRTTITSEVLHGTAPEVLAEALKQPPLRARLGELPPDALFHAAGGLGDGPFNEVADALLEKFGQTGEGASEGRAAVTDALVPALERLDEQRRTRIARVLQNDEIRRDFSSYQRLAEADPQLLPDEVVATALETLESTGRFGPDEPAYVIATAALLSRDEPSFAQVQKLGEVVTKSLVSSINEDPAAFAPLAQSAAPVLRQLDVPRTSLQESVENLDASWAQIPADVKGHRKLHQHWAPKSAPLGSRFRRSGGAA